MKFAIQQYLSGSLDLQTLIGELEFTSNALTDLNEGDFVSLNNALMDMESINCALIEGNTISEQVENILKNSILICKDWIEKMQKKYSDANLLSFK